MYLSFTLRQIHLLVSQQHKKSPKELPSLAKWLRSQWLPRLRLTKTALGSPSISQFRVFEKLRVGLDASINSFLSLSENQNITSKNSDFVFQSYRNFDHQTRVTLQSLKDDSSIDKVASNVLNSILDRTLLTNIAMANQIRLLAEEKITAKERSFISERANFSEILSDAIFDVEAHCLEKNGESPKVKLNFTSNDITLMCCKSHVHFLLVELLKNAFQATVNQTRELRLQELPHVEVSATKQNELLDVSISDHGQGMTDAELQKAFDYFFTTVPPVEPTYTYSGEFGSKFSGLGCGLPIARCYARFMGGDIYLASKKNTYAPRANPATTAKVILNRYGDAPWDYSLPKEASK